MDAIFQIQMRRVAKLLTNRSLFIEVTPEAATVLCDAGFDPDFGARPLKRAIQQYLLNPMSRAIVSGNYAAGDTVRVDVDGEHIEFSRKQWLGTWGSVGTAGWLFRSGPKIEDQNSVLKDLSRLRVTSIRLRLVSSLATRRI